MSQRLAEACEWLAAEFSATPDEFRSAHKAGSDMLLTGVLSHGYARQKGGRIALTDAGRRFLAAQRPVEEPA